MKKLIAFTTSMLLAVSANAIPNPTGGSGTPGHGNSYTVTGTGFGTKVSPVDGSPKPYAYFDFEAGNQSNVQALSTGGALTLSDQNMSVVVETRGTNSTRVFKSDSVNWAQFSPYGGIVSAGFTIPSAGRGGKVYKKVHRKSSRNNYTHTNGASSAYENWKFDRFWPTTSTSDSYPNTYTGQVGANDGDCSAGGGHTSPTVEGGGTNYTKSSSAYRLPSSTWMAEEFLIKWNSASSVGDGIYRIRQDGDLNINRTDYEQDPHAATPNAGLRRWFTQDDPSNLGFCGGSTVSHDVHYDDFVFDYGAQAWARVMIGDASTLTSCTTLEYQPASSWSSTSVTFTQKFGSLTSGATKYIYVFDSDDTVNANGLLLQAGAGDPPPVLASIDPTTGAYSGGGTITFTGTNFVDGCTVQFGTMTAISATFTSSTEISATLPPGPEGTVVDARVTNPDGQTSLLEDAMTYSNVPATPIFVDDDPFVDSGFVPGFAPLVP